jgi:hypothetical protein
MHPLNVVALLEGDPELAHLIHESGVKAQQEVAILPNAIPVKDLFMDEALRCVLPPRLSGWTLWMRTDLLQLATDESREPSAPLERLKPWPECSDRSARQRDDHRPRDVGPNSRHGYKGQDHVLMPFARLPAIPFGK